MADYFILLMGPLDKQKFLNFDEIQIINSFYFLKILSIFRDREEREEGREK